MTDPTYQPWICPTCGHFIVRLDPTGCTSCETGVMTVPYTGSEQADMIRRSHAQSSVSTS